MARRVSQPGPKATNSMRKVRVAVGNMCEAKRGYDRMLTVLTVQLRRVLRLGEGGTAPAAVARPHGKLITQSLRTSQIMQEAHHSARNQTTSSKAPLTKDV